MKLIQGNYFNDNKSESYINGYLAGMASWNPTEPVFNTCSDKKDWHHGVGDAHEDRLS